MKNNIDDLFKNKIEQINKLPDNTNWSKEIGWNDFENNYRTKNKYKTLFGILSIAASVIIVFGTILFLQNQSEKQIIATNNGKGIKKIILPDGNRVWLNKNSYIQYPKKVNNKQYTILVSGEAYFEIKNKKAKKYIIKAYNTITSVEQAAGFNIKAYKKDANVDITVASGTVKVSEESYREGLAILVTEGNYCSVHKQMKVVFSSLNKNLNYLSWKTGKIVFNNTSIETVVDVLAQYYGKQIILANDSLVYCNFSGTFNNQPINTILNKLHKSLGIEIKETGNKIILSGTACLTN